MKWECTLTSCEDCNIKTKRICNAPAHKIWKYNNLVKTFESDIADTHKKEELWNSLINTLKGASKVMKEVENHKHPEYQLKKVDPAIRKLVAKLLRGDYNE